MHIIIWCLVIIIIIRNLGLHPLIGSIVHGVIDNNLINFSVRVASSDMKCNIQYHPRGS